jgi:hypothetical protein
MPSCSILSMSARGHKRHWRDFRVMSALLQQRTLRSNLLNQYRIIPRRA